jgi:hypothetical protein
MHNTVKYDVECKGYTLNWFHSYSPGFQVSSQSFFEYFCC